MKLSCRYPEHCTVGVVIYVCFMMDTLEFFMRHEHLVICNDQHFF